MERGILYRSALLITSLTLLTYSASSQCSPGPVGNDAASAGQYTVSWHSEMIVNEEDVYTNTSSIPKYVDITSFAFNARRFGNPVTPFVALVRGDNDFLVLAIGKTRSSSDYVLGENNFDFDDSPTRIIVTPGATIATGFLEANPDGSGVTSATTVTLDTNGDEVWYTGGPSNSASGTLSVGKKIGVGQRTFTNLRWTYHFNITLCESATSVYAGLAASTDYFGVNVNYDGDDANIGDGVCADANGFCTMRAAIQEASAATNAAVIMFSATGDMQLDASLPDVTSQMIIDGYSAAGYQTGVPAVRLRGTGFNTLTFRGANGVTVRGMDVSGSSNNGFDSYALNFYTCEDVLVEHNVIRNRARAIHANGVYDLTVQNNDMRDCGDEAVDGAIFLRHVLAGDIPGGMIIKDNEFGGINTQPQSLFQVHYCRNVIVSDGSAPNTNIEIKNPEMFWYPIRFYETIGADVVGLDLSYSGSSMEGIGVRCLNSSNINISNCTIANRRKALDIDGGNRIVATDNDFSDSGLSSDEASVTVSNFSAVNPTDLEIRSNTYGESVNKIPTYLSFVNSSGINVGPSGSSAHIQMSGILDSYYPIRITSCTDMAVQDLNFAYASAVYHQSKAIWMKDGSTNINISGNFFDGWAAAVHVEMGYNVSFDCNTAIKNRNGILIDNNSDFASVTNNNFACNAVAVQHRGSMNIMTTNNYWGDFAGSSSSNGYGDYIIGSIDVTSFNSAQNACAPLISPSSCNGEICNNGIDDDLDGLVDCDDGSCSDDPNCGTGMDVIADHYSGGAMNRTVDFVAGDEIFKMYPNPTQGQFNLELFQPCESYRIYNVLGATVIQGSLLDINELQIDMSGNDNGAYMIELIATDKIVVKRLIKH